MKTMLPAIVRTFRCSVVVWFVVLLLPTSRAADWPPALEQYEAMAMQQPVRGTALWQLWQYALDTQRIEELKARWEARAMGPEGVPYRLLLGGLAELENDGDEALTQYTKATEAAPDNALAWHLRGKSEAAQKMP